MSGTHPEILYQLQQIYALELRERAATVRLATQLTPTSSSQWQQPLKQLLVYLTKVALLSSPAKKPAPSCC